MSSEMVSVLLKSTQNDCLTSKTHVDLSLDVCAQGLALPLAESETIFQTIELYKRWLLDTQSRPKPINEDEQYFTRVKKNTFSHLLK